MSVGTVFYCDTEKLLSRHAASSRRYFDGTEVDDEVNESECVPDNTTPAEDYAQFVQGYDTGNLDSAFKDRQANQGVTRSERAGYCFGWISELTCRESYAKWQQAGRPG
jgi:hypothetical protein